MRHPSQEKLRGRTRARPHTALRRAAASWLCLGLLVFGAVACGDDPVEPATQKSDTILPDWAQEICQMWRRADGSCDQAALIADFEDCLRTKGVPEMERLHAARNKSRMVQKGRDRATNLCLALRRWVITEKGRRDFLERLNMSKRKE